MKYWAGAAVAFLGLWPLNAAAAPAWTQWQSVPGVFDLGGPRSDGTLIVAGSAALYTATAAGDLQPFARGPGGYRDDPGAEAYLAVSPGQRVAASGCDFTPDDIFILRLHTPVGLTRVDRSGESSASFTNLDVPSLNGIAFDTAGAFDHRLLVTGTVSGKTELLAVDCRGAAQVVTKTAPVVEGGMAVAPETFGQFAGTLIAPDELSGVIWAITPVGTATQVVNSGLPKGGDIGVEGVAFVPSGFTARGGYVYYADRKTAGNPHPGTDSVMRLSSADLVAAGVQDGDLLAATEGGASMIAVRCDATCHVIPVVTTPTTAHGEGHIVFTMNPAPSPSTSPSISPSSVASGRQLSPAPFIATAAAVLFAIAAILFAVSRRR